MHSTSKHIFLTFCVAFLMALITPLKAQHNPYVDDKLIHFGFSLGVDFLSYSVEGADSLMQMDKYQAVYHARTTAPGVGFSVGFIADLRLARHLNLRFCPGMHFGERTLTYKSYQDTDISGTNCTNNRPSVLCLPIDIPLYLKWSAEREVNYRPYVTLGGGVSFDLGRSKDKVLLQQTMDYFLDIGIGCDLYFRWFKLAPEIRYRIGFNNVLTPIADAEKEDWKLPAGDFFYTDALSKLTNQQISLIFNFE